MMKFGHKLCKGLDAVVRQLVMNPLPPGLFEFLERLLSFLISVRPRDRFDNSSMIRKVSSPLVQSAHR